MYIKKYLLSFFLFFLCVQQLSASHIVGGEMNYRCLGNNAYEIQLVLFRDCDSAVIDFNDLASIGFFDYENNLIDTLNIPLSSINDTLPPNSLSPCLVISQNVCVHTTTYTDTIVLPNIPGGYQMVYQECCRNFNILNVTNSYLVGTTFYSYISEEALIGCNSSAVFNSWPPLYICVNEPIIFDHSAFDEDGDSLVYSLCEPLIGADAVDNIPSPPYSPPYDTITWSPGFGIDNLLGGQFPLEIDSITGLLTGTPQFQGKYVFGVCIEEYRNGALISTPKRDFQYNVVVCGETVANFSVEEVLCDQKKVTCIDLSTYAEEHKWDFIIDTLGNYESYGTDTVNYTYQDTGYYDIRLIVKGPQGCHDTAYANVQIVENVIDLGVDLSFPACTEVLMINALSTCSDSIYGLEDIIWSIESDTFSDLIGIQYIIPKAQGLIQFQMEVKSNSGCRDTLQFQQIYGDQLFDLDPAMGICKGDTTYLNPNAETGFNYLWSPADSISNIGVANPFVFPSDTTIYSLLLFEPETGCTYEHEIPVNVYPEVDFYLPTDTAKCNNDNIEFTIQHDYDSLDVEWIWYDPTFGLFLAAEDTSTHVVLNNIDSVIVKLKSDEACSTHPITIFRDHLNVHYNQNPISCWNEPTTIELESGYRPYYTYTWSPAEYVDNPNSPTPNFIIGDNTPQSIIFNVLVYFPEGECSDSTQIFASATNPGIYDTYMPDTTSCLDTIMLRFDSIPNISSINLTVQGTSSINYGQQDSIFITIENGYNQNVIAYYNELANPECYHSDTINLQFGFFKLEDLEITLPCVNLDSVPLAILNSAPENLDFSYTFHFENDYQVISNDSLFVYAPFPLSGSIYGTMDALGCEDSAVVYVSIAEEPIDYELDAMADPEEFLLGQSTSLSANQYQELSYFWTPSALIESQNGNPCQATSDQDTTFYLVARDQYGCQFYDSVDVLVRNPTCSFPTVFMPNAFSPNGDGQNDLLKVRGLAVTEIDLQIFNEWGEKVFQTDDAEEGWDGTFNGKEAPIGVYGYRLEVICFNGNILQKQGNITLIR